MLIVIIFCIWSIFIEVNTFVDNFISGDNEKSTLPIATKSKNLKKLKSKHGNKYSFVLMEKNNKKVIITKGLGNSIILVRFNCVSEIVVRI